MSTEPLDQLFLNQQLVRACLQKNSCSNPGSPWAQGHRNIGEMGVFGAQTERREDATSVSKVFVVGPPLVDRRPPRCPRNPWTNCF